MQRLTEQSPPKPLFREAAIILPMHDATGKHTDTYRAKFIEALIAAFGGVTVTDARGYWRNDDGRVVDEPVKVLTVAMAHALWPTLQRMASEACVALGQEAIYVRFADGEVVILTSDECRALTT